MPTPVGTGVYTKKNKTWGSNFKETPQCGEEDGFV